MTPLNIEITQISQTDPIPAYVDVLNNNCNLFKTAIETVVNNFKMDTTNLTIGDSTTPVTSITANGLILINNGMSFLNNSAVTKSSLYLDGLGNSVFNADIINATTITASSGITTVDLDVSGDVTFAASANMTFNGFVSFASAPQQSLEWYRSSGTWLDMTWDSMSGNVTSRVLLAKTTPKYNYLMFDASTDTNIYNGIAWIWNTGELHVYIDFDYTYPVVSGQVFNIAIRDIVDGFGTSLFSEMTNTRDLKIYLYAGLNHSESPGGQMYFAGGVTKIEFDNVNTFKSNVEIQYYYDIDNARDTLIVVGGSNFTLVY